MPDPVQLDRFRVVLVSTRNPLNIGAAARALSNFGFSRLRVVNPYQLAFREARSAVGAAAVLASAEEHPSIADAVADCSLVVGTTAAGQRQLHHPLHRLEAGAQLIRRRLGESQTSGNVALLFGSEKRGLSNEDLSHCHWLMNIPTRADHLSMNLGQAVAVCLYEIIREQVVGEGVTLPPQAVTLPPKAGPNPAASEHVERITTVLTEALIASGYMDKQRRASTEQIARRLVCRLELSGEDAVLLLGMLRQILWRTKTTANTQPAPGSSSMH